MIVTKIRTLHQNFLGYKVTLASSEKPFLACASSSNNRIYVSELFLETFSKEEQKAILAHEVGHLVLHRHKKDRTRELFHELEADRYSAEVAGFKALASALKTTIALSKKRYQAGLSSNEKFRRQQMEYSHRISNLLDFMGGKKTMLDFSRKNLS